LPTRGSSKPETELDSDLVIRPLGKGDWPHIVALFGDKGACGGCWCMYWRVARGGRLWDETRGKPARRQFHDLVTSDKVNGLLAFRGDIPIAWVCIGPYQDFPRLGTVRAFKRQRPPGTWAIVCFYIAPRHRRTGLGTKLLVAARDLGLMFGATVIEGYPVTVRGSRGLPGAFAWTGVPAMFAKVGFRPLDSDSTRQIWTFSGAAPHPLG
jgi:GNAT superfamily N-acetyltransferase